MKHCYVGIDLGGTNVRIAAVEKGERQLLAYRKMAFQKAETGEMEVFLNIIRLVDEVCAECEEKGGAATGIGIALAASFDRQTGIITKWPNNQKWNGFPLKKALEEKFNIPIILEDDANAAAIGEQIAGAGVGYSSMVYATISTGIGCGIIMNNHLLTGNDGWAGELGHIRATHEKVRCTCGAYGCLQAVASGPAILKRYKECSGKGGQKFDLEKVVQFAKEGDAVAIKAFQEAGTYIGDAIANIAILLDIPLFVLGGGVMNAGDFIMSPIKKAVNMSLQDKRRVILAVSKNSDCNGLYGVLSLTEVSVNKKRTICF